MGWVVRVVGACLQELDEARRRGAATASELQGRASEALAAARAEHEAALARHLSFMVRGTWDVEGGSFGG